VVMTSGGSIDPDQQKRQQKRGKGRPASTQGTSAQSAGQGSPQTGAFAGPARATSVGTRRGSR